jgi:hypothetical protein
MGRWGSRAAVATMLSFVAADAHAQGVTLVRCTAAMVASYGANGNGDRNGDGDGRADGERGGFGADLAVSLETPLSDRWSARAEAGAVSWTFQQRDYLTNAIVQQETVRVERVTVSAIQRRPDCGSPIRPYGGFGVGIYHYRYPDQQVTVTTGGLHGIAGVDVMPADHLGISAEIGIHAINGPRRSPVFSTVLWSIRTTVGVRVLF